MTDNSASMMTEEEFLEHAGVKGMKWGQRKSERGPSRSQQIHEARASVGAKANDIEAKLIEGATRVNKKYDAAHADLVAKRQRGAKIVGQLYNKKIQDLANTPEAKLALKSTTGEKVATGIALAAVGSMALASAYIMTKSMSY